MTSFNFKQLFSQFPSVKIGVIGDVMLDTYCWGQVDRISPEAPVPIVMVDRKEQRIGGAANVALNLCSLGAPVTVFSMLGADDDGSLLTGLLSGQGINTAYLLSTPARITTNKMRVICRNQQMIRLDSETVLPLAEQEEDRLIAGVEKYIRDESPQAMILEDYNKGVLTERVISAVIRLCRKFSVLTAVDPKRKHFFQYKNVDIFKPNLKEAREALNLLNDEANEAFLTAIHDQLYKQLKHKISFITLSERGVFYKGPETADIVPSFIRNVADVSGAGDTVIAVATLIYAITGDVKLMAEVANLAGGLVCESVGTVAIGKQKLLKECQRLLS